MNYSDAVQSKRAAGERRRKRAAKGPNRAVRLKRVKAQLAVLWSIAVRRRDKKCLMCGKVEYLQAHHWLFRKGHSLALAFNPANGATLCYGCHIGRIHQDGDGDFALRLCEIMTAKIGGGLVEEMREIARTPRTISLEELEAKRDAFLAPQTAQEAPKP